MICKVCDHKDVIKINKPDHVIFQCKEGHKWFENYIDNGGPHQRPKTYEVKVEDILFPSEKLLYDKVLEEIGNNIDFYTHFSAEEITSRLIDICKFNKEDVYKLFMKITKFNNTK